MAKGANTVDEYIEMHPKDVANKLNAIRGIIKKNAKGVVEGIGYGMPSYKLNGVLIYFSAHKNHIGIYPFPSAIKAFKKDAENYKTGPGTIQFQNDQKLPLGLITKIVKFRVKENLKTKTKTKK
jgi:uncharacterized protein YdhG (YjbR/CyaY superfamily)